MSSFLQLWTVEISPPEPELEEDEEEEEEEEEVELFEEEGESSKIVLAKDLPSNPA